MRIAITGSQGQIVRSLIERGTMSDAEIVPLGRPCLDLGNPATVLPAILSVAPDIIINAAAFTGVDLAESEETTAYQINAVGAGAVALAANQLGVPVIQLSTDYVFDGGLDRAYREDDAPGPINAYGRSKLAGEQAVAAAAPRHVILRTSWVYSPFGKNFVKTMLGLGETRHELSIVADQIGRPTSALDIADGVLSICNRLKAGADAEDLYGIFHMAGTGATNWAEFAEAIFTEAASLGRHPVIVTRTTSDQYKTPARRPKNSRLDTEKLAKIYGVTLPPWQSSLSAIIMRLIESS
jgi:dTDP-4-dehydrorhamnose reductase